MSIPSILVNIDIEKIRDEKQFIISNDAFFNVNYREYELDKSDYDAMNKIDGITAVKETAVTTKYGDCSAYEISTGLKTFLNVHNLIRIHKTDDFVISLDECGENAKKEIFNIIKGTSSRLFISGIDLPEFYFDINVNGKIINNYKDYLKVCIQYC